MISLEELFESGVHFGHRVNRWNPKMAEFIFGELNGIHIIDLFQTQVALEKVTQFLSSERRARLQNLKRGGLRSEAESLSNRKEDLSVLFVGTKKQIAGRIAWHAESISGHYVNHRWLGGLLTNWSTMKTCITKYKELESKIFPLSSSLSENFPTPSDSSAFTPALGTQAGGRTESRNPHQSATKKERALQLRSYEKMKKFFGGIKNMNDIPEIVIVVGQDSEMNAVRECQKCLSLNTLSRAKASSDRLPQTERNLGQRIRNNQVFPRTITLLDTNCDPSEADLFIPANDDSPKSVDCILSSLTAALGHS